MKMSKCSVAVTVVLATLLGGCATTGGAGAGKSEALRVAHAAGLKNLRDVSRADYDNAIRERTGVTASTALDTIAVGTGLFDPARGWTVGAQTTFLASLTLLSALTVYEPEAHARFLIWMPQEEASDPSAAAEELRDLIVAGVTQTMPASDVRMVRKHFKGSGIDEQNFLIIDGPSCSACEFYAMPILHFLAEPRIRKAPSLLGGYDAYAWSVSGRPNGAFSGFPVESPELSRDERMNILTRLSKNLPRWIYVYVPPKEGFTGFPLILHQGNPMFFVEPAT